MEYITAYGVIAFCLTLTNIVKIRSCAIKIHDFFKVYFMLHASGPYLDLKSPFN